MAFKNILFPLSISVKSSGGIEFATTISKTTSGVEFRNGLSTFPTVKYNIASGIRSNKDIEAISTIFRICEGRLHSFLFQDPIDFKVINEELIPINLDKTQFQFAKKYKYSDIEIVRNITKPDAKTCKFYINNIETFAYSLDEFTGILTLNAPLPENAILTADFNFFIEVRFDTDFLNIEISNINSGIIQELSLIEVR